MKLTVYVLRECTYNDHTGRSGEWKNIKTTISWDEARGWSDSAQGSWEISRGFDMMQVEIPDVMVRDNSPAVIVDIPRMQAALDSGIYALPEGLTPQEAIDFIVEKGRGE